MSLIYSAIAWGMVVFGLISILDFFRRGSLAVQQLHKIPCSSCQYFSCNYVLKCSVHPYTALTESAINCQDYTPLEGGVYGITRSKQQELRAPESSDGGG